jgi:hypothetical protein
MKIKNSARAKHAHYCHKNIMKDLKNQLSSAGTKPSEAIGVNRRNNRREYAEKGGTKLILFRLFTAFYGFLRLTGKNFARLSKGRQCRLLSS